MAFHDFRNVHDVLDAISLHGRLLLLLDTTSSFGVAQRRMVLTHLSGLLCSTALAAGRAETITLVESVEDFLVPQRTRSRVNTVKGNEYTFWNSGVIRKTGALLHYPIE